MEIAQQRLLMLLQYGMTGQGEPLKIQSFEEIEELALAHFSMPLAFQGAMSAGLNPPEEWQEMTLLRVAWNLQTAAVQKNLIDLLSEHGIPCAVLKGTSVASCYPDPSLRPLGDIDLLVSEADYRKAITLALQGEPIDEEEFKHDFHYQLFFQDTQVEIHKAVTRDSAHGSHQDVMADALTQIKEREYEGINFPVLSAGHQAASLLLHTQRHFIQFQTNLRILCDWAMFVKDTDPETWKNEVLPVLKNLELEAFSDALIGACNRYLGLGCEDRLTAPTENELTEFVMLEFLYTSSASRRSSVAQRVGAFYAEKSEEDIVARFFSFLNQMVRMKYKRAGKYPVLYPLLWILMGSQYLCRGVLGKREIFSFRQMGETFERRKKIYDDLGLKERGMK